MHQTPLVIPFLCHLSATSYSISLHLILGDITQKLGLQYKLPLLIFLTALKGLIILPPHRLVALSASNIPYNMSASGHVALGGFACGYIYDVVEEVGFAVLAAEILQVCQSTMVKTLSHSMYP